MDSVATVTEEEAALYDGITFDLPGACTLTLRAHTLAKKREVERWIDGRPFARSTCQTAESNCQNCSLTTR